ncbi:ASCH domain-containing protein [Streptomyces sp. NBC_00198]|uniref:ASCH domain-containing protein n=1 Tax=Streptomyces sp. NBC_00198 TaxID=2975677 RepID=UPI0022531A46|nr:ASCH domain-containing protein [Streptomyces sp. NBC_00198]MCX5285963.1 ASCH domain-containing protein [Streptomyces sp. NBC_00198]MCX5286272.1 ASCH domain-containing protein [Streptomyces sp. NBC_00198]
MPDPDIPRGLTIRQPWAFAIAEGFKTIENRTRRTNYRGSLLIHAGRDFEDSVPIVHYSRDAATRLDELGGRSNFWDARAHLPSRIVPPPPTSLALSAVIATARLDGCHEAADGCCAPWGFADRWHWELANVQPLQTAVPRNGALSLWKPDAELLAAAEGAQR